MAADGEPPTLADVVRCGAELATELASVLATLPSDIGSPEPSPVRILRNQTAGLRSMDAAAQGFWARRQTWSLGRTAVVVVPAALRGLHESVAPVAAPTRARCSDLIVRLADLLERHASQRSAP